MGQHFVAVGQRDAEHCARQDLRHRARQFNWFFFRQAFLLLYEYDFELFVPCKTLPGCGGTTHFYGRGQCLHKGLKSSTFWPENMGMIPTGKAAMAKI